MRSSTAEFVTTNKTSLLSKAVVRVHERDACSACEYQPQISWLRFAGRKPKWMRVMAVVRDHKPGRPSRSLRFVVAIKKTDKQRCSGTTNFESWFGVSGSVETDRRPSSVDHGFWSWFRREWFGGRLTDVRHFHPRISGRRFSFATSSRDPALFCVKP